MGWVIFILLAYILGCACLIYTGMELWNSLQGLKKCLGAIFVAVGTAALIMLFLFYALISMMPRC